jgi:hypothetical protein
MGVIVAMPGIVWLILIAAALFWLAKRQGWV